MEPAPTRLNSTPVYKGRILDVSLDQVQFGDGRVVKMEVVRHPGSVVLLPMTAPGRLLLVRQYRYVVDRWLWELPAGTLEPGEALEAAALRECHEEVGRIAGKAEKIVTLFPSPGFCDEAMNFFLLTDLRLPGTGDAEAQVDPDEILSVREFSVDEIDGMVRAGAIADMKTVVGLSLIRRLPIEIA